MRSLLVVLAVQRSLMTFHVCRNLTSSRIKTFFLLFLHFLLYLLFLEKMLHNISQKIPKKKYPKEIRHPWSAIDSAQLSWRCWLKDASSPTEKYLSLQSPKPPNQLTIMRKESDKKEKKRIEKKVYTSQRWKKKNVRWERAAAVDGIVCRTRHASCLV